MFSVENNDRKESEEGRIFQNKCVSSQNKQYEKRRGRYRSGYTLPSLSGPLRQAGRAAFSMETFNFTGKPHKIRQMSY
jgi:hypothetical protein